MKRIKNTVVNLLVFAVVLALSIGWWVELQRFVTASAALDRMQADVQPAELKNDEQPVRQYIPVAGVPKGAEHAPITIVEFVDFQCPYCGRATETIDQVFKEYLGQVRFSVRHSPLPFHPGAPLAAEAALAAEEQGKFWQMHDKLLAGQRKLAREDVEAYAQEIGLDMDKFSHALDAKAHQVRIDQDIALAEKVGAKGTPVFFVNGRKLMGAQPFEAFKTVIDEELSRAGKLIAKGTPAEKIYDVLTANAAGDANAPLRR